MSNHNEKTKHKLLLRQAGRKNLSRGRGLWIAVMITVIFVIGMLFALWTVMQADRRMRTDLLQQARVLAQAVDVNNVKALHRHRCRP